MLTFRSCRMYLIRGERVSHEPHLQQELVSYSFSLLFYTTKITPGNFAGQMPSFSSMYMEETVIRIGTLRVFFFGTPLLRKYPVL